MRFRYLPLLLAVSACASPYERCVQDATRDANTLSALVAETEANITRGYAIDQEIESRVSYEYCFNSRGVWTLCRERDLVRRDVPVAIDLEAEERKLAGMREKLNQLKAQAGPKIRACQAQFPQG